MRTSASTVTIGELLAESAIPDHVANITVLGLSLDSRKIENGWLFLAVKGALADGRAYIAKAIDNGAVCVFRDAEHFGLHFENNVPVIDVPNLSLKVSAIAGAYYGWPAKQLSVVAVTGTNGKSSCAILLSELVHRLGKKSAFVGTLGFGVCGEPLVETGLTTPDPIACQRILSEFVNEGVLFVAMEASSHAIAQGRLAAIDFVGLIFTNLSRDHLDYHRDIKSYEKAKLALFESTTAKFIVTNTDDSTGNKIQKLAVQQSIACVAYGKAASADVHVIEVGDTAKKIAAILSTPWGRSDISSALIGDFNLYNLMAVITAAVLLGESLQDVVNRVPQLKPVPGRMQRVLCGERQDVNVIVDYAHTPDALEKTLRSLATKDSEQLWVIFGCGGDRDSGKRPLMGQIAATLADKVVITSDNPRSEDPIAIIDDIINGVPGNDAKNVISIVDRAVAIETTVLAMKPGDTLLIAGKGHENTQVIGSEVIVFDDQKVAVSCLRKRAEKLLAGVR